MNKIIKSVCINCLIVFCITLCASMTAVKEFPNDGIIRHDMDIEQYLKIGSQPEFDCVGRYSISVESTDYAVGILISPKWVLTASHFIEKTSVWKFGDKYYHTKDVIKHPDIKPDTEEAQWSGKDLALVELAEPAWDIKPAARYYGDQELGRMITKIGYGFIGNGKSGLASPRKQERLGGHNKIDAIGGMFENRQFSTNVMVCDFDSPESSEFNCYGASEPLALEIGGSKGDSGGGVFFEEKGQMVLVGVVSGALNREIKYGSIMALARVSTANEWIDSVIYNMH